MIDPGAGQSPWWMAVGLWTAGAACGPLPPAEGVTDSATSGPTSGPTSDPTSEGTTEVDPTMGPECVVDDDCNSYCASCDVGVCIDNPDCYYCAYTDDAEPDPRCSPPYYADCYYSDSECPPGEICQDMFCEVVPQIPICDRQTLVLSTIALQAAPSAALLVDLNLDQLPDLVVALPELGAVEIALGDGVGGFTPGIIAMTGLVGDDQHLAASDFDLDGDPDLAILRSSPIGELSLLFGQDAMFLAPVLFSMGQSPLQIFAGRIDADDAPDVLVTGGSTGQRLILRSGDGLGNLGPAVEHLQENPVLAAGAGDLDSDGLLEIAAPIPTVAQVTVFDHVGGDSFFDRSLEGTGWTTHNSALIGGLLILQTQFVIATRTVNGIGTISVWPATAPDFSTPEYELGVPGGLVGVALGDIDGDGRNDLVALPDATPEIWVVFSDEAGLACLQAFPLPHATAPELVAVADIDGDGDSDLVIGDAGGANATLLRSGP